MVQKALVLQPGIPVSFSASPLSSATASGMNGAIFVFSLDGYKVSNVDTTSSRKGVITTYSDNSVEVFIPLETAITSEWVAMQLTANGANLLVAVNSERQAIARFNIAITSGTGKRDGSDVSGTVVNGVAPIILPPPPVVPIATAAPNEPKVLDGKVPAISDKQFVQNATVIALNVVPPCVDSCENL
ncbi:hypothetical protein HDU99_009455, partial [Rhizoclosmatium hyalinum]